jgi:transposase InsO family protein
MLTENIYHDWWPGVKAKIMTVGAWTVTSGAWTKPTEPTRPVALVLAADADATAAFNARMTVYRADEREYKEWISLDQKAQGTILGAVSPAILQVVAKLDSAKAMWDHLKTTYEAVSHRGLEAFYVQSDIIAKRYVPGDSMQDHVNFIRTQNARLGAKAFSDEFLAMLLLHSLPSDRDVAGPYASLVYQLITSVPDADVLKSATVEARLLDFARLDRRSASTAEIAAVAGAARRPHKPKATRDVRCTYGPCGKQGHEEDSCYMKKRHEKADADARSEHRAKKEHGRDDRARDRGGKTNANAASTAEDGSDSDSSNAPRARDTRVKASLAAMHGAFAEHAVHEREWEDSAGTHHTFLAAPVVANLVKISREHVLLDSGCSRHLSPRRDWFDSTTYRTLSHPIAIHLGDASMIQAIGVGSLHMLMDIGDGKVIPTTIPDVLHVPQLSSTLLSVSVLTKHGHTIEFKDSGCRILTNKPSRRVVAIAFATKGGLYLLDGKPTRSPEYALAAATSRTIDINVLHRRLGHLNFDDVRRLVAKGMVGGVDAICGRQEFCEPCVKGKQHRLPFPVSGKRARRVLDLIHSDVVGPFPASITGARYFVTFIDDHGRHIWLYPIHYKSDVFAAFKSFKAHVELLFGVLIRAFQSDNGGEYMLGAFQEFLKAHGIIHRTTVAHTPEQNGLAERTNRSIVERVRTMLQDANLSSGFWSEAALTSVYLINLSPASKLGDITPRETTTGEKPWIAGLRPFGCPSYVHVPKEQRKKLDSKTRKCVLLGYESGSKAYRLWDPSKRRIIKARDVVFDERGLPSDAVVRVDSSDFHWPGDAPNVTPSMTSEDGSAPEQSAPAEPVGAGDNHEGEDEDLDDIPVAVPSRDNPPDVVPPGGQRAPRRRRTEAELLGPVQDLGQRTRQPRNLDTRSAIPLTARAQRNEHDAPPAQAPPAPFHPAEPGAQDAEDDADADEPVAHMAVPAELDARLEDRIASELAFALAAGTSSGEIEGDPRTLREAEQSAKWPSWETGIDKEHNSLVLMGTFGETVDHLPPGRFAIDSKLVFRTKLLADGSVDKEKVRLVAKGFSQRPGQDFDETFAPVVKFTSLRVLCCLAVRHCLFFDLLDVETAYLHGRLEEELYIRLPKGFGPDGGKVKRLLRSIYGLKQAGRVWNELLCSELEKLGYRRLESDYGIYIFHGEGDTFCIIATYVDDMPHLGNDLSLMRDHQDRLNRVFKLKRLELSQLLGMAITYDRDAQTLVLSQRRYIREMATRYGLSDAKPAPTPLSSSVRLTKEDCPTTEDERLAMNGLPYASLLGSLMFAMLATRPDIAYAVGALSKFSSNPGLVHWRELKRVLRYLLGTIDTALVFRGALPHTGLSSHLVHGYTDSDWAGELDKRRSTAGYVFLMAGAAISWSSKLQSTPALSSTEAEYVAASRAAQEAIWLRALLDELGFGEPGPTLLLCDNQGALALARNPVNHPRTRHIALRFHFIRKAVSRKQIQLEYCPTEEMAADVFTKGLGFIKHRKFTDLMGMGS